MQGLALCLSFSPYFLFFHFPFVLLLLHYVAQYDNLQLIAAKCLTIVYLNKTRNKHPLTAKKNLSFYIKHKDTDIQ